LNALFPQANFNRRAIVAPGTQKPRVSTGLELQVLMPVVNAPFRLYWAYNLSYVNTTLQPPLAVDRSFFPNDATFRNLFTSPSPSIRPFFATLPFSERHSLFRFSVGRTF
jgi:outer membrane protein insertion porin family